MAWALLLLYTGYFIWTYCAEVINSKSVYEAWRTNYEALCLYEGENQGAVNLSAEDGAAFTGEGTRPPIMGRYASLLPINEDLVGWITIPGTAIAYPVVKTDNNDFYLAHNVHKEPARGGSIFMDFRNTGTAEDLHTILYGHNMKDGSMFRDLMRYKKKDYFDKHPVVEFNTLYAEMKWEIFSVYVTSGDFYYLETYFPTVDDYGYFLESIQKRSLFKREQEVTVKDRILTLSTCSYESDDARFVVHAKRSYDE